MSKRVISFSLWGQSKQYCCGAIANARLAPKLFPGWTCRFYCADDVPKRVVDDLKAEGAEIMPEHTGVGFVGLFWRLKVADDVYVDRFIVRDTDSRLTPRDAACVKEWEESGLPFHIIRDCESHGGWILGATFGMVNSFLPEVCHTTMQELLVEFWEDWYVGLTEHGYESDRGKFYGVDQEFLSRKIWNLIRDNHLAHVADYACLKFTGKEKLAPPINRKPGESSLTAEAYVGQVCNLEPEWELYSYDL